MNNAVDIVQGMQVKILRQAKPSENRLGQILFKKNAKGNRKKQESSLNAKFAARKYTEAEKILRAQKTKSFFAASHARACGKTKISFMESRMEIGTAAKVHTGKLCSEIISR